jgi:hypothetical protein
VRDHPKLGVEVQVHPSSNRAIFAPAGFGWHPTSRARLFLWSEWATREGMLKTK